MTLSTTIFSWTTLRILIFSIIALSIMAKCCYADSHSCWVSFMVSVTYKPFMLSVVILSVVAPFLWHIFSQMAVIRMVGQIKRNLGPYVFRSKSICPTPCLTDTVWWDASLREQKLRLSLSRIWNPPKIIYNHVDWHFICSIYSKYSGVFSNGHFQPMPF
jgi:hypothetical protein